MQESFFKKIFSKDFWKLKFLNLNKFKWIAIVILSVLLAIFFPFIVQTILNIIFLIASFILFMIIYAIVSIIKEITNSK